MLLTRRIGVRICSQTIGRQVVTRVQRTWPKQKHERDVTCMNRCHKHIHAHAHEDQVRGLMRVSGHHVNDHNCVYTLLHILS